HPLTQEVAYRSQLGERRAATHAAVARALETVHGGKFEERAGLLAYHWECAGEKWTAAEWHGRAADWIGVRGLREKDRHWRHVRTLLAEVPESPAVLTLGVLARRSIIYNAAGFGGAEAEEASRLFAEGMALASRLDD